MKTITFRIQLFLLFCTPITAFCQSLKIESQEEMVLHYMWQLAQRQANLEQQLGFKPSIDLTSIDPSDVGSIPLKLEAANKILKKHEALAYGAWLSNPLLGEEHEKVGIPVDIDLMEVTAEIGGNKIKASNLGVILDVSGSMSAYLEPLRAEIIESFPKAHFAEITGCRLDGKAWAKDLYSIPGSTENPFDPRQFPEEITRSSLSIWRGLERDTLSAFVGLVKGRGVDSIFWFCDLRDGMSDEAISIVKDLIEDFGVQVFVTSLSKDGPREFRDAVESNEGCIIIKDGSELLKK